MLSRPDWAGTGGKPKYEFLVPPIVRAEGAKEDKRAQVCARFTHTFTINAF